MMIEQEQELQSKYQRSVAWRHIFLNSRLLIRLAALVLLVVIYFSFDWVLLQRLLRSCTAFVLNILQHDTTIVDAGSELFLIVDWGLFSMTKDCTYFDLFLLLAPFCWRFEWRIFANVLRLTVLAIAIFLVNLVRVSLALHLNLLGISWTMVHTVPTKLLHCAAMTIFVLLAVRSDWHSTRS